MLYLKKFFTEGLIQVAILLSLCGVRVDVGLESYLLPSWQEMMLGPTSALTQTQFHNLHNRLEDGHGLHPKSVDLDGFFTSRRLLGWVRSLDRLQVPHAELETWLVQCESDPSPLQRAPAGVERDRPAPPLEPSARLNPEDEDEEEEEEEAEEEEEEERTHHVLPHGDDREEEEEDEVLARIQRYSRTEEGGRPRGSYEHSSNRERTENEVDQTSVSLQECLRLLEENFPFSEEQQLSDVAGRRGDLDCCSSDRDPLLPPIIPTNNPSLDLELQWQDLLAIMEPEDTDVDMTTSASEAAPLNPNSPPTEADQELLLMEASLQHGLLPPNQPEPEPVLLPLRPSAELDHQHSAPNPLSTVDPVHAPPDHTDLLIEDPSEDFYMGLNAEDNPSSFNMNLLTQDAVEPEHVFDVNFHPRDLSPSSFSSSLEGDGGTQDFLGSPPRVFLADDEDAEDVEDEGGLPSPLSDLLEDASILEEIKLLDLALEEGFSPEMAARLEEEGYLDLDAARQETDRGDDHSGSNMAVTDDQGRHQQDGEDEAESDSGLSLDFSHSPASPSASEASYYSSSSSSCSSSSSSSASSLSGVSDGESPLSEDEDEDAEEGVVGSDMEVEVEVFIKQEEVDEEELGAAGGEYPGDTPKLFSSNSPKLFPGFPWLQHVGHDHTYNQPGSSPGSSPGSPFVGKMSAGHTGSARPHGGTKPYRRSSSRHITQTKMWGRDERRARALKIPFSNEQVVNLPVDDFNDLLTNYQLDEDQLALVRDIRRRGKNKIAAQNCRKRKLDTVLALEDDVSGLRRHRSRLLREKKEALRNLQEMKRRLATLYQEVFSRMRDDEGRPLDTAEYLLHFGPDGQVMVASRQQGEGLRPTGGRINKKQRDKKK
ncbi:endoplasmic reticulum membrane sensor NFE2L1a [Embiotoca jacksoni]|uniref:endoplasmic reticulum membrane sensor NFE2L1a n=1 Tax=Embiotoca jacksoni TaxID=100190 RepID=UPI0037040253